MTAICVGHSRYHSHCFRPRVLQRLVEEIQSRWPDLVNRRVLLLYTAHPTTALLKPWHYAHHILTNFPSRAPSMLDKLTRHFRSRWSSSHEPVKLVSRSGFERGPFPPPARAWKISSYAVICLVTMWTNKGLVSKHNRVLCFSSVPPLTKTE